jgi:hypothetical protein
MQSRSSRSSSAAHVLIILATLLALSACGGSSTEPSRTVVYDEAKNGPLPYALDSLSASDLAKYTVSLSAGENVITGTSITGEAILLRIPSRLHLQSIAVDITTHFPDNGLTVYVERFPYDGTYFTDYHPIAKPDRYTYSVSAPSAAYGNGDYALRIGTTVSGASVPNEFSLSVRVGE